MIATSVDVNIVKAEQTGVKRERKLPLTYKYMATTLSVHLRYLNSPATHMDVIIN